ncbi:MAG: zinc-finger domain-containing protein [Deltaproteobacteria bacterium]
MSAFAASAASVSGASVARVIPANAEHRYSVTHADLPLSCPMPGMSLWNSHPKVYLPVEATGTAQCPYCGAVYTLTD